MSYEEDYRRLYSAKCACGKGYLQFYRIYLSNDWGQEKENDTEVEIFCDSCKEKYHYERNYGDDYLVPNGLTFPQQRPELNEKYAYNSKEKIVKKYDRKRLITMMADMTAPKHRFVKNLENEDAISFANSWVQWCKKKSLAPMVSYLQKILDEYDDIESSIAIKQPYNKKYEQECDIFKNQIIEAEKKSYRLSFQYDRERNEANKEQRRKEQEQYEEKHRYDDFEAVVHYDASYKRDFSKQYWDSYFIKECIDSQHLSLDKSGYGKPIITIAKKYACICQICGKEEDILSSSMKILYDGNKGYYLDKCCSCHEVSSFEAKTMDILNQLGITYIREKSFDGLVGDSGKNLRFDFVLFKSVDKDENPIIDLAIELQGPHHYKKGYYDEFGTYVIEDNSTSSDRFNRQIKYDERKRQYCERNGISLERIKYTASNDLERLEKTIKKILKDHGYKYFVEIEKHDDWMFY